MSTDLLIDRKSGMVHYLCHVSEHGVTRSHVDMGEAPYDVKVSVNRIPLDEPVVTLHLEKGAFHFNVSFSPAEARLLARALNAAADEADAAGEVA